MAGMAASGALRALADASPEREHLTRDERVARGKAARTLTPLDSQAEFAPTSARDPVGLLSEQAATRVPELVPIRYGRMLASPMAYYRGAALPMTVDLAGTPVSGLQSSCRRVWPE